MLVVALMSPAVADDVKHVGALQVYGVNPKTLVDHLSAESEKVVAGRRFVQKLASRSSNLRYKFESENSPHRGTLFLWQAPQRRLQKCDFVRIDDPTPVIDALMHPAKHETGHLEAIQLMPRSFRHTLYALEDRAVVVDGKSKLKSLPSDLELYSNYFRVHDEYLLSGASRTVLNAKPPAPAGMSDEAGVSGWFDARTLPPLMRENLLNRMTAPLFTFRQRRDSAEAELGLKQSLLIDGQLALHRFLMTQMGRLEFDAKINPSRQRLKGSFSASGVDELLFGRLRCLRYRRLRPSETASSPIRLWCGFHIHERDRQLVAKHLKSIGRSTSEDAANADRLAAALQCDQIELLLMIDIVEGQLVSHAFIRTEAVAATHELLVTLVGDSTSVYPDAENGLVVVSTNPQVDGLNQLRAALVSDAGSISSDPLPANQLLSLVVQTDELRAIAEQPQPWTNLQPLKEAVRNCTATFGTKASELQLTAQQDRLEVSIDCGRDLVDIGVLLTLLMQQN